MNAGLNVLSLFDGISCCRLALERAGINVNTYYTSEIEPNAIKVSNEHYPDSIRLGDVNNWKEWNIDWKNINLITFGSPCFTGDTLILTDRGYIPIVEIKQGDKVLSHDNKYHEVEAFLEQGKKEIFELKIRFFVDNFMWKMWITLTLRDFPQCLQRLQLP